MKGNARVLELLNRMLRKELTGINQYFVHSKMCENWGYRTLAKRSRHESIGEMKHTDKIIERILFLEGTPNMAEMDKLLIGADVRKQIESDLGLEMGALQVLREGISICNEAQDHATRDLVEQLIVDEEEHVDWLETQLHQIQELGYENYLAQQIYGEEEK